MTVRALGGGRPAREGLPVQTAGGTVRADPDPLTAPSAVHGPACGC